MPIFNSIAKAAAKPLPRVISPKGHAIVRYMAVGSMLGGAAWLWRRNKRAAFAALLCAGTELALNMATDYEGAGRKPIDFDARRKIDLGMAATMASIPEFIHINRYPERTFFLAQGALSTVITELTRYSDGEQYGMRSRRRFKAA